MAEERRLLMCVCEKLGRVEMMNFISEKSFTEGRELVDTQLPVIDGDQCICYTDDPERGKTDPEPVLKVQWLSMSEKEKL